jgi:hypothetical protein
MVGNKVQCDGGPLNIRTDPPSTSEIREAAKKLKNRKSPGLDRMSAEMIKASDLNNNQSTIRLATDLLGYSKKETPPSQVTGGV